MRNLQKQRQARGWTRQELGARASVGPGLVGKIENSRETPRRDSLTLQRLARAFGIPENHAGELLDEDEQ